MPAKAFQTPTRLLVIGQETGSNQWISRQFPAKSLAGFSVKSALTLQAGIASLIDEPVDCVLLQDPFSYTEKINLKRALRAQQPEMEVPVIELGGPAQPTGARLFEPEVALGHPVDNALQQLRKLICPVLHRRRLPKALPARRGRMPHTTSSTIKNITVSHDLIHSAPQAAFDGIAIHDRGVLLDFNQKLLDIFGYQRSEVLNTNGLQFFTPASTDLIQEFIQSHSEVPFEVQGIRKNGTVFPVEIMAKTILYRGREARMAIFRDISERRSLPMPSMAADTPFRETFEQAAVGMLHLHGDGQLIKANLRSAALSGFSELELLNLTIYDLLETNDLEKEMAAFRALWKGELDSYMVERQLKCKDGQLTWINLNVSRVLDSATAQSLYLVAVMEDINDRKKTELDLKAANHELEAFVSGASHDLRSPLASLMGLCSVAQLEVSEPDAQEYLGLIGQAAAQLNDVLQALTLVNQVKKHLPQCRPIPLKDLVTETLEGLHSTEGFDRMNVRISQHNPEIQSDPYLLRTALNHLLHNCLVFGGYGENDTIDVLLETRACGQRMVQIRIQDNGPGVPAAYADKIFDMFYKASTRSKGPGLGLYLVKKIAEKLGGSVHLNRRHTSGAEFILTLPGN